MRVDMTVTYKVELTPRDFNLISKALRCVLSEEDFSESRDLQFEMMKQKLSVADHLIREWSKLRENLEASNET